MSKFVDQAVREHKVMVFSKIHCPYCVKAKNVLSKYQIDDISIVELDNRSDANEIQDYLAKITGARTVPRVFINGNCIGGGDDTARLDKENRLKPLLQDLIRSHDIVVLYDTNSNDQFKKTKLILKDYKVESLLVIKLDKHLINSEHSDYLFKTAESLKLPSIFIGGYHIGTHAELEILKDTGNLKIMLSSLKKKAKRKKCIFKQCICA